MKLRLPNKLQAALVAAIASVSFTTLSTGTIAVATGAALLAGQRAQAFEDATWTFESSMSADTKISGPALTYEWKGNGSATYVDSYMVKGTQVGNYWLDADLGKAITFADGQYIKVGTNPYWTSGAGNLNTGNNEHNSYTVMAWVKLDSTSGEQEFFGTGDGVEKGMGFGLNGGKADILTKWIAHNNYDALTVSAGQWVNVAFTYDMDSNTGKAYINGELVGSKTIGNSNMPGGECSYIGASAANNNRDNFAGQIAELKVLSGAYDQAQIMAAAHLTSTAPAPVEGLVWAGNATSSEWNTTDQNWSKGAESAAFTTGDNVAFDNTADVKKVTLGDNITAGVVTVNAAAYEFAMEGNTLTATKLALSGDNASLSLTGAGTVSAGSISASDKTINIGKDVVLQGGSTAAATLAGTGTYALENGSYAKGSINLGGNWTGTVRVTDLDANGSRDMSGLRTSLSTLELKGFNGWMSNWTGTLDYNIKLTNGSAGYGWRNGAFGNEGNVMNNTGIWSGNGKFVAAVNSGRYMDYTYSGNISAWTGEFELLNGTTKLKFSSNATEVKAKITQTGGALKLYADTDVAFSNTITVTSLDVTANKQATFGGTTNIANGVTLNSGSTLVNTGAMTLGGTIVFGENSIQNNGSGTINFGSNIHFDITNLAFSELEGVTTYTLFSGNAVDLSGYNTNNITVAGGTAGKEWTFGEDGTISFQLSRSVDWNNGADTGKWNYTDANWSEGRKFESGMVANFFTNAEATVSENVVAGGIVVGKADAEAPTVTIAAEGGSTLTAGSLDVVKGTLTTGTAILGLESVNIASGTTWNINADQTLDAGAYAGAISVGAGHTVTLSDAGNASSLLKGISGDGNITLTVNTDLEGVLNDKEHATRTQATGTLTLQGITLRLGKMSTSGGYQKWYVDLSSFDTIALDGGTLWVHSPETVVNNVTVDNHAGTIHVRDSDNDQQAGKPDTLKIAGKLTLNANLTIESTWKNKVSIAELAGAGKLTLSGGDNQVINIGGGTVGSMELTTAQTHATVTGNLTVSSGALTLSNGTLNVTGSVTVSSGDLTLSHGTLDVAGSVAVNKALDLSVGGGSNATLNIKGGGTVTLANTGNASFWGDDGSHLNLEEGGTLALDKYGLSITGLAGGGSITFPNNTQYGIGKDGITITGANVTVTAAGTGAVTIGNKLTNSKLTTGSHEVTLSHAEDSLVGLTISNGGSFTLNNTSPVDVADIDIEAGGTLVLGAENLISGEYTVDAGTLNLGAGRQSSLTTLTINDGGMVISSRQGQASGFLANNGTVVINGSGVLKFTGNNDALGWGGGHVASVTLNGTDAEHVATLDLSAQSGSETMASNLVLNGYSLITKSSNNRGFNTYGGSITVTGTENEIERMEVRANATINVVGAADTLSVGVMALGADGGKELTKTGAGTLTFTESAASTNLTVSEGAVVSKGTATLGALNLQGGSYTVEAGSTTVTGLTTMTNSATLANAGELTLNSLTMGAANTLTNTGALQLNGTVLFGTAGIANNGTGSVAFADDIIFNISQLQEGEGHTYTLFTGDSAVDLTALTATAADHITGVTVTGRAWTFSNNGQLSYEILSRNLVWNGGAGTWTTDTETTPWHVDGSEEPVSFATGDAARFAASGTSAEVTLGSNITAAGITVDAGAMVTVNPEGHTLSADVANIDGVLTSALATHSVTIGESGVWNMAGGTLNVADVSISNEGLIHLMDGAKVTATKDNVSTLGAVSAEGTGTLEVGGTGAYTFAGQESDPFAGRLIYNIGSTGGHDSSIRLSNFEGTLEIRGRVNYSNSQFGNMSKLVFNGDRSSNTTGLWNTGVANIGVDLDIIGDQLVDFYASNTINVNGNINAAGVQGHLGKENDQTMNLNGITNLLSLRVKNGTVNLKDGTIGTIVVNGGKTVNFNGALAVTDSLEANVNTNLTVGAEGVLDIAGISIAGTAQGTTITTSANNSVYSLGNESYTITNADITAKQDVEIANKLTNSMVYTDDKAVTLSNIDNVVAGATVGLGSFGMTGGTLSNAITNAGTVSLTEVTLGGGFSEVAEDVHFDLNGDVVTDMNANYYLGVEEYVQVVNGGTITGGSTARWADHSYGVQSNGRIILEEALADYTTYFVQSGDVSVGEVLDLHELTNTFYVSGGTLYIDGAYSNLNITVTDSGTISGYTTPAEVTIVPEAEVTFEEGIEDTNNGVTFSSSEGGVVVKNTDGPAGGEAFKYTIDQTSAQVTADVLRVNSEEDVTIANQLDVTTIVNEAADGESTLKLTHSSAAENVENVRAIRGDIAFANVEEEASIELKELTIGTNKTVGFNTSENVFDETHEATVVIAAATAPEAQDGGVLNVLEGATLNANLVMEAGSTLDVSYAQDSHGLIMGSSVTLKEGVLLQDSLHVGPSQDMNAFLFDYFKGEGAPEYYYLYDSVEELYIQQGAEVKRFTQLDFVNWRNFDMDASRVFTELDENTYALVYNWDPIHKNVVALRLLPEPTTGTLSLLALCALAARRRRK
ncbi:MAG: LamG-like jellyroll fold domain-containing protein [Akkermansia sp.]|nr:LamG-like jellyroll fold domain-containing protein [Akkermansia sp.]